MDRTEGIYWDWKCEDIHRRVEAAKRRSVALATLALALIVVAVARGELRFVPILVDASQPELGTRPGLRFAGWTLAALFCMGAGLWQLAKWVRARSQERAAERDRDIAAQPGGGFTVHKLFLQADREGLLVARRKAVRWFFVATCLAVLFVLVGATILFVTASPLRDNLLGDAGQSFGVFESGALGAGFAMYVAVFALWALMKRSQIQRIDTDIAELDFEIEFAGAPIEPRERRAEKLLHLNQTQLRRYYTLNIGQNRWTLFAGLFCIAVGLGLVVTTIVLVTRGGTESEGVVAVVGSLGAILSNFVGALYVRMHGAVSSALQTFHGNLVKTHRLYLASLLVSRVDETDRREQTLADIAKALGK